MRKIFGVVVLVGGFFVLGSGMAGANVIIDLSQSASQIVNHEDEEAPLDPNGCHIGPTGFHCH